MKDCIFKFGRIDKKIIWPFLFAIIQVALIFINQIFPKDKVNQIIDAFAIAVGDMLVLIVPFIFKTKEKIIKKDEICTKKNIKYQAIHWAIGLGYSLSVGFSALGGKDIIISLHFSLLVTREAAQIIILIVITMIIFKSKYYIHHIICLVIFCGLCVGIDLLLNTFKAEFSEKIPLKIVFNIIVVIFELIRLCYHKYMMNNLYYHYWSVSFSYGLFTLIIAIFSLISVYIVGDKNDENNSYFQFLKNTEFRYLFPRILSWIIIYGLLEIFKLLALESLTPNHMMISYEIGKIANILYSSKSRRKWHSLILFAIQFIILLFFLEVFEFNFCNLNKNTRRNIEERSLTSMDMRESINSVNELDIEGYSIRPENNENTNEMQILNNDNENFNDEN